MQNKTFTVRIVKPSDKPTMPKIRGILAVNPRNIWNKTLSFLAGSGIGIIAGITIYLMLLLIGIDLNNTESSLIIGLPSLLGLLASYVVL